MEKIINRLIDEAVVNVDKYVNNNSTWLIFTESKQWVIELTKDGTLWYNYNFFKNLFVYMSMDVVENQQYITKWVEDNIINGVKINYTDLLRKNFCVENTLQNGVKESKPMEEWVNSEKIVDKTIQNGVKETKHNPFEDGLAMEEAIQNGVKHLRHRKGADDSRAENIIQNGVKETFQTMNLKWKYVEDTIQNGVKETRSVEEGTFTSIGFGVHVEDTIQNGVKHTEYGDWVDNKVEDTIQNGVKHTEYGDWLDGDERLDDIIDNGIKETKGGGYLGSITMGGKLVHMVESPKQNNEVEDVIQHSVIETFDETHHRRREVVRTIRDGIKQTCAQIPSIDAVVERVVEEGIKQTIGEEYHHRGRIDGVIKNGIKEVQPLPAQDGNRDWGNYYHRQKDRTKPHTQYVNDVIENSIKETIL